MEGKAFNKKKVIECSVNKGAGILFCTAMRFDSNGKSDSVSTEKKDFFPLLRRHPDKKTFTSSFLLFTSLDFFDLVVSQYA